MEISSIKQRSGHAAQPKARARTIIANNQLTQWGATGMSYDLNGNTLNDGANTYSWDARNRLVSADNNGATDDPIDFNDPFGLDKNDPRPPCSPTGSLPSSVVFSYGGNADIGGGPNAGFKSTAGAGAGFFYDSAASSVGAFASGGAAGYFGPANAGTPSQQGQPFSFGAYAGVGPSVWFSNAHTAQQLAGPFTTYSFNAGGGLFKGLSLHLSVGGGIWQLSIGLPIPYSGASTPSLAFSKLTTTTAATHGGCKP